jgi:hypothetical protein
VHAQPQNNGPIAVVNSVRGCSSSPLSSSVTIQCPTAGGLLLTIIGQNFPSSSANLSVTIGPLVGSLPCSNATLVTGPAAPQPPLAAVTCVLPAGVGSNMRVTVGQWIPDVNVTATVSYAGQLHTRCLDRLASVSDGLFDSCLVVFGVGHDSQLLPSLPSAGVWSLKRVLRPRPTAIPA